MKKIVILGAGRVGSVMAIDLKKKYDVVSVDFNKEALNELEKKYNILTIVADLSKSENIKSAIKDCDIVINAVPGFMGFNSLKAIIESGKNVVDIAFFPEDPFELDELAKKHNVTAVVDCGVAPGMGNIILGRYNKKMQVEKYECLVGGLPVVREWPFEYKAVFSPIDVIEEYIRPARYVQSSEIVIKEALSDAELVQFPKIGTLESWNSDGLRSLIKTMNIPNMIEKTLRYPGTIEYLRVLRDCGFFSYEEVEVNGNKIRPIDLTSKLLFPKWKLKDDEEDFTVMRIIIEGKENNKAVKYQYMLVDRYEKSTKTISMARTTGYTATAVANLLIEEKYNTKGIIPPEYLGEDESNFNYILDYLKERNVNYEVKNI
ncbi:MAG: saccharopine dehydrogenase NADP-binding domain-containing protein [Bacteroidales bacterium]|nr:saccharopine dehydrogenase NADP-binding domain-containing protein [Bacteroidales bacterium]MBN2757362.1 saccharopine dehydrogenase NADP-binding domain-containing protein [Bacteroidales bacterium]